MGSGLLRVRERLEAIGSESSGSPSLLFFLFLSSIYLGFNVSVSWGIFLSQRIFLGLSIGLLHGKVFEGGSVKLHILFKAPWSKFLRVSTKKSSVHTIPEENRHLFEEPSRKLYKSLRSFDNSIRCRDT